MTKEEILLRNCDEEGTFYHYRHGEGVIDGDIVPVFKAMDEYASQQSRIAAIAFALHVCGQLKCNPENKTHYDEGSNESFLIMLPATIEKRYNLFIQDQKQ